MLSFFTLHNLVPFFVFTLSFAFLLNYQSESAWNLEEEERNHLFLRFLLVAFIAAAIMRWRVFLAMPIPIVGSRPHTSAARFLVSTKDIGLGSIHKCSPPERRFPVAYRFFDNDTGAQGTPPVAVYFPCTPAPTSAMMNDDHADDDHNNTEAAVTLEQLDYEHVEYEKKKQQLFQNTCHWLPKNDLRVTKGVSDRQQVPEFALYHWQEVRMRATKVDESNEDDVVPPSDILDTLCSDDMPLIILGHGDCTNCNFYSGFAIELASRGAVVVVPWFMDGSSSGCILKNKDDSSNNKTNDDEFIPYRRVVLDETIDAAVEIKEGQLGERILDIEDVANKLIGTGALFQEKMLGWVRKHNNTKNSTGMKKAFESLLDRIKSSYGVSLLGHSFGAATVFSCMTNRMLLGDDHHQQFKCRFRNYICYDLWSLPIKKYLAKLEAHVKERQKGDGKMPFPYLELLTSGEWSGFEKTHLPVINRLKKIWPDERYRYEVKVGTDHLSLCDGGLMSPKYFRHRESKRKGLWTDDAIFICDYAVQAFAAMKKS